MATRLGDQIWVECYVSGGIPKLGHVTEAGKSHTSHWDWLCALSPVVIVQWSQEFCIAQFRDQEPEHRSGCRLAARRNEPWPKRGRYCDCLWPRIGSSYHTLRFFPSLGREAISYSYQVVSWQYWTRLKSKLSSETKTNSPVTTHRAPHLCKQARSIA